MSGTQDRKKSSQPRKESGWGTTKKEKPNEKLFEFFFFLNENEESRFQFLFTLLAKMFRCFFFFLFGEQRKKFNKPQFLPQ